MGICRPDLAPHVKTFPVENYIIIYRPQPDGIKVLTVIHGSRDIPVIFRDLMFPSNT
jgi:toxin ParE1/3/4